MTNPRRKIVLIEDDPDLFDLVAYSLFREGFETIGQLRGEGAVEFCEKAAPDLILLDAMLPDSDGFDICRRLKAHPVLAAVPVIFVTARGEEADRVAGLEMGAEDYVVKPFSLRELVARIRLRLRNAGKAEPPRRLQLAGLELDHDRHRVTCRGQELDLTPTEFRLLSHFMTKPGLVFTRSQLLDEVWGSKGELKERVVDVCVLRLRQKIESNGEVYIQSIRGYGYRFDDPTGRRMAS